MAPWFWPCAVSALAFPFPLNLRNLRIIYIPEFTTTYLSPAMPHNLVYEHQAEYYTAISESTRNGKSSVFIEFMLQMILDALDIPFTPEVRKMLGILTVPLPRKEIMQLLHLKDEKHFREHYLQKASAAGLIEMTLPDKPNSRNQKYHLTDLGREALRH